MSSPIFTGLRKCEIIQNLGKGVFSAKDLLTGEIIEIQLTGKQRMNYIRILPVEQMYAKYYDYMQCNRCLTETNFKHVRESIWEEKKALDNKLKKLGIG